MPPTLLQRRRFSVAGLALAASIAAPALHAQSRPEKARLTLAVGGKATLYYLPLTIAEQLGYFKEEGLDVDIQDFSGGARALQAVLAGSADVCSGAFEHTINLQSSNRMFQAFVLQGRAPQIAVGVSTRTMVGYSGVGSLRGRRIGVSAPGSSTNMVARLLLSRFGVRHGEVEFVGVGTGAGALEALRAGQLDAMSNTEPVMTMLELQGDVRIIADTRTLKGTQELFGGAMPAACLYAPEAFVQKHPRTCQALAHAIVHALKWLQTAGPGDIVKTVPENNLLGDRALYLASFHKMREAISPDGLMPEDGAATALRALASFDTALKPDRIDLARLYTNMFARKAKDRFKI
ncbi:ABC transporter substrate-binding protein [Pseudorhodoferax sp. Leaf267]|uniref:ABC transporter substrate-binding protein n=1 Tax=Pseudorhodoferax sp. Leaf267 TaxID=1736316 RepID=UPI0006FAE6A8|nr:ABC transporter substrate-binding protein [Pseudorhodoferax sp. Leaf267]KQP22905.1 ABC transporter substrate-binding protein [Pseudorhodoferax sp. Leaf267]